MKSKKSHSLKKKALPLCLQIFEDSQLADGMNNSLRDGRAYTQEQEEQIQNEEYENNIRRHNGCPTCGRPERYCEC